MTFIRDAEQVARNAMAGINPVLVDKFAMVVRFLALNPKAASNLRGKWAPDIGSREYIERQAQAFSQSRVPRAPQPPETIPDTMVSEILVSYFDVPANQAARIQVEHQLSMGAESVVGELLERYLASKLEPIGWVWCSGSLVKAVDFIKPPRANEDWQLLQVKNRDNSENSSSSAIRIGTDIQKWHRTFSRRAGSNWAAFPDPSLRPHLSEEGFKAYVRTYLASLRESDLATSP